MTESNPTTSALLREWDDEPEEGRSEDDWPYPDYHAEYLIGGHLADLIRERTGETGDVIFEELRVSGGWSEWTQEDDYSVTIRVGDFKREFEGVAELGSYHSALPGIQRWLEGA